MRSELFLALVLVTTVPSLASQAATEDTGVTLDEGALTSDPGWVLVEVVTDRTTEIRGSIEVDLDSDHRRTAGAVGFVANPDDLTAAGWTRPSEPFLTANHDGHRVSCCGGQGAQGLEASAGVFGTLHPGNPWYLGIAAVDLDADESVTISIDAEDEAALAVNRTTTGDSAEAIDLVREANSEGTNVAIRDSPVVGEPGDAHETFDLSSGTLVNVHAEIEGDARGQLGVRLPDGRELFSDDREELLFGALTGPEGRLHLDLRNVDHPDRSEEGELQVTALVADVPIPYTGSNVHRFDHGS